MNKKDQRSQIGPVCPGTKGIMDQTNPGTKGVKLVQGVPGPKESWTKWILGPKESNGLSVSQDQRNLGPNESWDQRSQMSSVCTRPKWYPSSITVTNVSSTIKSPRRVTKLFIELLHTWLSGKPVQTEPLGHAGHTGQAHVPIIELMVTENRTRNRSLDTRIIIKKDSGSQRPVLYK